MASDSGSFHHLPQQEASSVLPSSGQLVVTGDGCAATPFGSSSGLCIFPICCGEVRAQQAQDVV